MFNCWRWVFFWGRGAIVVGYVKENGLCYLVLGEQYANKKIAQFSEACDQQNPVYLLFGCKCFFCLWKTPLNMPHYLFGSRKREEMRKVYLLEKEIAHWTYIKQVLYMWAISCPTSQHSLNEIDGLH